MKSIRLDSIPAFSWKTRLAVFASIFSSIWLFIDPLTTFINDPKIWESFGIWGYLVLLILSFVITFTTEYIYTFRLRTQKNYIKITMILTEDGTRHLIEVPQDLRVDIFINLFLRYAKNLPKPDKSVRERFFLYNWTLFIESKNDETKPVVVTNNQITLAKAGLVDGDVCTLHGIIKNKYLYESADWS